MSSNGNGVDAEEEIAEPTSLPATAPEPEPGAATDLELMQAIQAEDPDALSQLYDRYNGILKALILRVIHNEAEAEDLLQEIFMEIWNQAKNFSAQKGKPLGWMVTLARRRAIDGLRKKQAYARAGRASPSRDRAATGGLGPQFYGGRNHLSRHAHYRS